MYDNCTCVNTEPLTDTLDDKNIILCYIMLAQSGKCLNKNEKKFICIHYVLKVKRLKYLTIKFLKFYTVDYTFIRFLMVTKSDVIT